ncbi:hypothetical protein ACIBHY_07415 [Nonomuraea sp. NPDC050547]|uniref:hypothetical protein n=1 Tax=Nonomuraea sp. NPDC050547 TaxID=3364368 RepID=UPI0037A1B1E3
MTPLLIAAPAAGGTLRLASVARRLKPRSDGFPIPSVAGLVRTSESVLHAEAVRKVLAGCPPTGSRWTSVPSWTPARWCCAGRPPAGPLTVSSPPPDGTAWTPPAEVTAGDGGVDTGGGGQGGRQTPVERPWNGMSRPFAVKTRHQ